MQPWGPRVSHCQRIWIYLDFRCISTFRCRTDHESVSYCPTAVTWLSVCSSSFSAWRCASGLNISHLSVIVFMRDTSILPLYFTLLSTCYFSTLPQRSNWRHISQWVYTYYCLFPVICSSAWCFPLFLLYPSFFGPKSSNGGRNPTVLRLGQWMWNYKLTICRILHVTR